MNGFFEEEIDPVTGLPKVVASEEVSAPSVPNVRDYLINKYGLSDKYSDANREKVVADSEVGLGAGLVGALGALGAGFQGKNSVETGMNIVNDIASHKRKAVDDFDKGRDKEKSDILFQQGLDKANREESILAEKKDVSSERSMAAQRMLIEDFGMSPDIANKMTAEQIEERIPTIKYKLDREFREKELNSRAEDRRLQRELSSSAKQEAKQEKIDKDIEERSTPFGVARTKDDAKKLKEAAETKASFDSKLSELIELREKQGTEFLNRDAVARGKQLSKELLLQYKNMAKLGVLSQSDEAIINAIIPSDPLEMNISTFIPMAEDNTLNRLKALKNSVNEEFNNSLDTRIAPDDRAESPQDNTSKYPLKLRKEGKVATVNNEQEEKEARSEGWQ